MTRPEMEEKVGQLLLEQRRLARFDLSLSPDQLALLSRLLYRLGWTKGVPMSRKNPRRYAEPSRPPTMFPGGTPSELISHAGAVLDNPTDDVAVMSLADHLSDHYPDDPHVQAFLQWIHGEKPWDQISDLFRPSVYHPEGGHNTRGGAPDQPYIELWPRYRVSGSTPRTVYDSEQPIGTLSKRADQPNWRFFQPVGDSARRGTYAAPDPRAGQGHRRDVPTRGYSATSLTSTEVAQHLHDSDGLRGLILGVIGARQYHPETTPEQKSGVRFRQLSRQRFDRLRYTDSEARTSPETPTAKAQPPRTPRRPEPLFAPEPSGSTSDRPAQDLKVFRQQVRPKYNVRHPKGVAPNTPEERVLLHDFLTQRGLKVERGGEVPRYDPHSHTFYHPTPADKVRVTNDYITEARGRVKLERNPRRYAKTPDSEGGTLSPEQLRILARAHGTGDRTGWGALGDHLAENGYPNSGAVLSLFGSGGEVFHHNYPVNERSYPRNPGDFSYVTFRDGSDLRHLLRINDGNVVHNFTHTRNPRRTGRKPDNYRYAKAERERDGAHPLIAGFPIEHALRHLANDARAAPELRDTAKHVLTTGDTSGLWGIHDLVRQHENADGTTGHPILKAGYNFMSAADKILLDRHTRAALTEEGNTARATARWGVTSDPDWTYGPHHAALRVEQGMRRGWQNPRDWHDSRQLFDRVRGRVKQLSPDSPDRDVDESIKRHVYLAHKAYTDATGGVLYDRDYRRRALEPVGGRHYPGEKWEFAPTPERTEQEKATRYRRPRRFSLDSPIKGLTASCPVCGARNRALSRDTHTIPCYSCGTEYTARGTGGLWDQVDETNYPPKVGIESGTPEKLSTVKYAKPNRSDFLGALRRLKSSNHGALTSAATDVAGRMGIPDTRVLPALHDAPGGSVPGVAQAVYGTTAPEKVHELAAWVNGLLPNSPGYAVFHPRPGGPDTLYRLRHDGSGMDLRARLDRAGIKSRVLIPHRKGFDVLIPDKGNRLSRNVADYAQQNGLQVEASPGHFQTVGSPDQGQARETFRNKVVAGERVRHSRKGRIMYGRLLTRNEYGPLVDKFVSDLDAPNSAFGPVHEMYPRILADQLGDADDPREHLLRRAIDSPADWGGRDGWFNGDEHGIDGDHGSVTLRVLRKSPLGTPKSKVKRKLVVELGFPHSGGSSRGIYRGAFATPEEARAVVDSFPSEEHRRTSHEFLDRYFGPRKLSRTGPKRYTVDLSETIRQGVENSRRRQRGQGFVQDATQGKVLGDALDEAGEPHAPFFRNLVPAATSPTQGMQTEKGSYRMVLPGYDHPISSRTTDGELAWYVRPARAESPDAPPAVFVHRDLEGGRAGGASHTAVLDAPALREWADHPRVGPSLRAALVNAAEHLEGTGTEPGAEKLSRYRPERYGRNLNGTLVAGVLAPQKSRGPNRGTIDTTALGSLGDHLQEIGSPLGELVSHVARGGLTGRFRSLSGDTFADEQSPDGLYRVIGRRGTGTDGKPLSWVSISRWKKGDRVPESLVKDRSHDFAVYDESLKLSRSPGKVQVSFPKRYSQGANKEFSVPVFHDAGTGAVGIQHYHPQKVKDRWEWMPGAHEGFASPEGARKLFPHGLTDEQFFGGRPLDHRNPRLFLSPQEVWLVTDGREGSPPAGHEGKPLDAQEQDWRSPESTPEDFYAMKRVRSGRKLCRS